ncbi:MAG: O-antigen ligase family protein [Polyangiaceae bacterium]|nr:O-antigen ligase family protein [Polyangiaceae bacterium]
MTLSGQRPLVIAFAVLAASLPFARPPVFKIGAAPVQLDDLLIGVVMVWSVVTIFRKRVEWRFRVDGLLATSLAFLLALLVSALLGKQIPLQKSLIKLAAFSAFILLPSASQYVLRTEQDLVTVVRGWLIGSISSVTVGVAGVVGFYVDRPGVGKMLACSTYGLLPSGNYPRLCAAFLNPNMHANYLTVSLALALSCGAAIAPTWVVFGLIGIGSMVAAFTLSAGMGGFALAGAVSFLAFLEAKKRAPKAFKIAVYTAAGLAAVFFALTMIADWVPAGDGQVRVGERDIHFWASARPKLWAGALKTWVDHPLVGLGYGSDVSFQTDPKVLFSPDQIKALNGRPFEGKFMEAHNLWLNVGAQSGLIGFGLFVALVVQLMSGVPAMLRTSKEGKKLPLLPDGVFAAVVGALAYHGIFGGFEEARHTWVLLALLTATKRVWLNSASPSEAGRG